MAWELDAVREALEEGCKAGYQQGFEEGHEAGYAKGLRRRDLVVAVILGGASWSAVLVFIIALVMLL